MRVRLLSVGAGAVAAVVVASSAPAFAVAGGQAAPAERYSFVAKLDVGDGVQACSGALVAAEWVLTAAACLETGAGAAAAGRPVVPVTASLGRGDLPSAGGQVRSVVQVVPHATRGVLLARLAAPVRGVTPVALASAPAAVDSTVRVAGYGRTQQDWLPAAAHSAEFTVREVSEAELTVGGDAVGVCRGDAGGPALQEAADGPLLTGVINTSWPGGCLDETEPEREATAIRVDDLGDWVRQSVVTGEPVGRWDMSEMSGTTLGDSTVAGPAHPASVSGAALGQSGRIPGGETAVRFDGVNDGAATVDPVVDTAGDYTVSAWVRPTVLSAVNSNVVSVDGARTSMFGLGKNTANKWVFWTHSADTDGGGALAQAAAATGPKVGVWTHLAGVFTVADRSLALYVDGALAATATMSVAPWTAGGAFAIGRGRWVGANAYFWAGDIAEVKAWNRALTRGQMPSMANAATGRWAMQDRAPDSSGYDRHLTSVGRVLYTDGRLRRAASFGGVDQVLTGPAAVRTDQSYSVSAWVRADRLTATNTNAVSQDGTRTSMFGLGKNTANRWTFWLHTADSDSGGSLVQIVAAIGPVVGVWAHLTGVYDAAGQRIILYVNGEAAGAASVATVWPATSRFVIGGGRWKGADDYRWSGSVDEVHTVQGVLTSVEVRDLYQRQVAAAAVPVRQVASEPAPVFALEDFSYPGEAKFLATLGIRLIAGDGRIRMVDCATPVEGDIGLLRVSTTALVGVNGRGRFCFRVSAPTGVLELEVPAVYEIRGDGLRSGAGHRVTADLESEDGRKLSVVVDPDGSTPVGEGEEDSSTTLLRLRATG
ncbi:LamG-like jellyroll fold domain-containing protein [Jidongwangia harbinensis]|uniref:LamG-like jellyroll fold domain-containing protein n=1 Tax=Jidongwangia harbinensis TaxID=2878561 RepID=UPI001CDA1EC4|nr:LamG-like jellyroll fold domain-containing protein [Jidongwangia harbinensis]MCA2216329.1 trypsin-like serine protease [Jidongwangia harbinensis]MCA2217064.1 trypsin-like serine protease [Jidongwangia harbinensis]